MDLKKHITLATAIIFALFINIFTGCGSFSSDGPSLEDMPHYPNATEGESIEQSSFGGIMKGNLAQFTTTDSYDDVVRFYTDSLEEYNPQIMSHTSELGRQTAFSIPLKKKMISVAIQEISDEGTVNIAHMAVGG